MNGPSHFIALLGKPARPGLVQAPGCQFASREQPVSASIVRIRDLGIHRGLTSLQSHAFSITQSEAELR